MATKLIKYLIANSVTKESFHVSAESEERALIILCSNEPAKNGGWNKDDCIVTVQELPNV